MTGEKNHMFGKTFSSEERKRFGQPGERNARYGVKLSPEFKALLSERIKIAMARPDVRERFMATRKITETTRERMKVAARKRESAKRQGAKAA